MTNRGVLIEKFFSNYPSEAVFDNDAELKECFTAMVEAIAELRSQAINSRSVAQLQEVHTMETDVSRLSMMIEQGRRRKHAIQI